MTKQTAEWLSTTCFLNSMLREWQKGEHTTLPASLQDETGQTEAIRIPLRDHPEWTTLWLPLLRHSTLGRHRFAWPPYAADRNERLGPIGLMQLAAAITGETSIVGTMSEAQRSIFLQRLFDSYEMTAEALAARAADLQTSMEQELNFREAEQLLIVGHSFHPTPKSRDEFSAADKQLYSPEMAGRFPLAWAIVKPDFMFERSSEHFQRDWIQELIDSDPALSLHIPAGFRALPMHPWQAEVLRKHPALVDVIAAGDLRFVQAGGDDWFPTSSLRSIYRPAAPFMLKFSMSVKLTNSVRHLLVHEVERGVQVYDVLHSDHGRELLSRETQMQVITEPAYAMLKGSQGQLLHESIVVCRENPFRTAEDPQPQVLATLTQEDPLGRGNLILHHIHHVAHDRNLSLGDAARLWFQTFCQVALKPLMVAQADFGILLGAHQQNMLIAFKDHLPDRLYFRDCQGTGYAEWAYERMHKQVASLDLENGNVVSHDMGVYLFTYYLIINSAFNVITAVADSNAVSEETLLGDLRALVQELVDAQPFDNELLLDLLDEETLMHKGNFLCSVQGINENTSKNPLAIYTPISNPLRHLQDERTPS